MWKLNFPEIETHLKSLAPSSKSGIFYQWKGNKYSQGNWEFKVCKHIFCFQYHKVGNRVVTKGYLWIKIKYALTLLLFLLTVGRNLLLKKNCYPTLFWYLFYPIKQILSTNLKFQFLSDSSASDLTKNTWSLLKVQTDYIKFRHATYQESMIIRQKSVLKSI